MEVLIFIVVIVVLILVHELGHFVVAKWSGMRVDEFGLGYPPRAALLGRVGETEITLNWLPFGGFVRIFGEDPSLEGLTTPNSFSSKPRLAQAAVLLAGIAMNLLFAYLLLTTALIIGAPQALAPEQVAQAKHVELAVEGVLAGSPAALAGVTGGDEITTAHDAQGQWSAAGPTNFSDFVAESAGAPITLGVLRSGKDISIIATPTQGIAPDDSTRYALGVEVVEVGVLPVSFIEALSEGATATYNATILVAQGLWHFFAGVFTLTADLSQVTGPVGIAGAVGAASSAGLGNLFSLTALISINLAIVNLIPVPALDGGRLLFVLIEGVTRRRIKPSIFNAVNMTGFALLILLMIVVTLHDVYKIIG